MPSADFPPVILTVDCVLLTLLDSEPGGLAVALQVRPNAPFENCPALPGGYVHADADADLDATARRVLREKLGLDDAALFLEQLCTVSGIERDPRGWSASVVYYALVPRERLTRCSPAPLDDGPYGSESSSNPLPHPEVPKRSGGLEGALQGPPHLLEGSFEAADAAPQDGGEGGKSDRKRASNRIRIGLSPLGEGFPLRPGAGNEAAAEGRGRATPLPGTPQAPSTAPASPALPAGTARSLQASPGEGGDTSSALQLTPVDALPPLAFDHAAIVAKAVERLRAKTGYSNLPGFLLPETFSMPELIAVYERVLGLSLDQSVFRRRMDELGLIEPVPDAFRKGGRHRPAQLYRLSDRKASLHDRIVAQKPRGSTRPA